MRCYLTLDELPDSLYPAFVYRQDGLTLLTVDPRATRLEATVRSAEILSEQEAAIYVQAYAETMVGTLGGCDSRVTLYVPLSIRLEGDQPTQGGMELLRRHEAGEMEDEMAMIVREYDEKLSA